jgi:chitodextrinase
VGTPAVAGKSVAVTLARHLRGAGPDVVPPAGAVDAIPPGTPTLSVGTAGVTTANLSWTAVGGDGPTTGGSVTSYELERILGSVATMTPVPATQPPGGTVDYVVTGLSGASTYLFNVRAVDAAGNRSPWSNRVTVTTVAAEPPPATDLAAPLDSVRRTSVTLVWKRPTMGTDNAALADYIVKYRTGGAFLTDQDFDAAQPEIRSGAESVTIENLDLGMTYWFAVKVVDVLGATSAMSNVVQATTADHAPDPIADLRVIGTTTSSVTLRWTMPADDSPEPIASYIVKYTDLATIGSILSEAEFDLSSPLVLTFSGAPTRDTSVSPPVETLVVTGLTAATRYWFSVKALDEEGQESPLSASPTAVTSTAPADLTAPGAITDLAVVAASTTSSSLDVTWTATGDDGTSGTATEYDLRYAAFPLDDEQAFSLGHRVAVPQPSGTGSGERITLVGLSSNTQYFIGIKVIDEAGNASFSNVAVGQTGLRRGYTLVSIPKDLSSPDDAVLSVFQDEVGSPTLYRWSSRSTLLTPRESDIDTGCYDGYPDGFSFDPQYTCTSIETVGTGLGYYLYNPSESIGGRAVLDADGGISVAIPTYEIPLALGFNMVGNPYEREIHLSAVMVKLGATGTPIPYSDAVAAELVGPSLMLFDGVVSRPYGVSDPEAIFKPWNGGWIQSFVNDAILVFPGP